MGCKCNEKATTTKVWVWTSADGSERVEYGSKPDAEYQKSAKGGGTVTPVQK